MRNQETRGFVAGAFIALASFVLAIIAGVFLTGCSESSDRIRSLDNGIIVIEALDIVPSDVPCRIDGDDSLRDDGLDYLPFYAQEVWNSWVGAEVVSDDPNSPRMGLSVNYNPVGADLNHLDTYENVHIQFNELGEITSCECVLNVDYAYDSEWMELATLHCVGHCCFGLADDSGPPETVDLRSIMSSPLDPLGEPTEGDLAIIRGML